MYDLPEKVRTRIISILSRERTVEQAILFGSRARGDSRYNSDIDIALIGQNIPLSLNTKLREAVGLYMLDIVRTEELDNQELAESIEKDGVLIYTREEASALNIK